MFHMIDHHGVASHVAANMRWQHMGGDRECNVLPGNNIEERLHFLNDDKNAFYNQFHVQNRLPNLKEDNTKSGEFPELRKICGISKYACLYTICSEPTRKGTCDGSVCNEAGDHPSYVLVLNIS